MLRVLIGVVAGFVLRNVIFLFVWAIGVIIRVMKTIITFALILIKNANQQNLQNRIKIKEIKENALIELDGNNEEKGLNQLSISEEPDEIDEKIKKYEENRNIIEKNLEIERKSKNEGSIIGNLSENIIMRTSRV